MCVRLTPKHGPPMMVLCWRPSCGRVNADCCTCLCCLLTRRRIYCFRCRLSTISSVLSLTINLFSVNQNYFFIRSTHLQWLTTSFLSTNEWNWPCITCEVICDISPRRVVIPSRRMRWAGHVARMGKGEVHTGFGWGNLRERDHLEDTSVDGRILWRWIFREWDGGQGLDLSGSGYVQVAGCCKCGNELSGPVKCGEFLD